MRSHAAEHSERAEGGPLVPYRVASDRGQRFSLLQAARDPKPALRQSQQDAVGVLRSGNGLFHAPQGSGVLTLQSHALRLLDAPDPALMTIKTKPGR